MTIKRIIALLLSLLLVLTALPQMLPAAQAEPPAGICPNSPNGKHAWSKSRYIPPSCTLYGMWIYGCSLCKKQHTEITEPALGHDWSAWTRTKSPTCTEKGANTRTCNRCQKVESEDIAALGHIYATKTYTSYADCTHYGAFYWTCSRCGNKSYGNDKPLGHDWDEGRMTKAPTATEDGEITYTCKRDPSHTMTEAIHATGEEAQQEDHPSLELSIECDGGLRGTEWNEIGDTMWFLVVDFTLTNTGDVPLKVNTHYYNKVIELQPGESYSGINFENTRLESKGSVEWDKMTYTPDDVINLGYVDIGRVFAGHAAEDGQTDWDHPLCQSNECELRVYIKDPDHAEEDSPERVDSCSLMLTGMSDTSASYTLHTCYKHLETAEAAEALCIAGDWKEAAELWRAETDKLYDALSKTANGTAAETLEADREAFFDYAKAVQLLFGDGEAAELMRLRCAKMCCVLNNALPYGLYGTYMMLDTSEAFEVSSREIGALRGRNSLVTEHYAGHAAEALAVTRDLLGRTSGDTDHVPALGIDSWMTALGDTANPVYKAANYETKVLIAAWRMTLEVLRDADEELCTLLCPDDPAAAEEYAMELYKEAALLIGSMN